MACISSRIDINSIPYSRLSDRLTSWRVRTAPPVQSTLSQPPALGSPQQNPPRSETHPAEVASKCRGMYWMSLRNNQQSLSGNVIFTIRKLCQGARTSTPSTVTLAAAEAAAAAESALSPTVVSATSAKPRICFFGFGFAKSQSPSQTSPKCANLKKLKKLLNYRIMQSIASPVASIMAKKRSSTCSELRHSKQLVRK